MRFEPCPWESGEAGFEREVQVFQPDVRWDTQDAELVGAEWRAALVGALDFDINGGDTGI